MDKQNILKIARTVCIVIAIAVVVIPILITTISGQGFSETVSHIFTSVSLVFLIAATLCSANWSNKKNRTAKIATCIGLMYALIMQWT